MKVVPFVVLVAVGSAILATAPWAGRVWPFARSVEVPAQVSFRGSLELAPGLHLPESAAFRLRIELRNGAQGEVLVSETVDGATISWPYQFRIALPADQAARATFFQARLCHARENTNLCNMGVALWEPIVRGRVSWPPVDSSSDRQLGTVYFNKHYARPEVDPCGKGRSLLAGRVSLSPGLRDAVAKWQGKILLSAAPYVRIAEGMARVPKEDIINNKYFRYSELNWRDGRADFRFSRTTDRYGHYDLSLIVCDPGEKDASCLARGLVPAAGTSQGRNQIFLVAKEFIAPFCGDEGLELYAARAEEKLPVDALPELKFSRDLFHCPDCFRLDR